ncbi:MAG: REP-associated tyrosine transposase [Nitrospirales bacterium]
MARPLRLEFPGAVYHLTSRGNARQRIVRDEADRAAFLTPLGQVVDRFGWRCYAFCLMDNHYHLLVETPQANLSWGMRQLNGVYTQAFNRRHRRVGHLFQGRFKAILVEKEAYLLELCRYVVLNPVRAGVVARPEHWAWSSFRATAGATTAPAWLQVEWVLGQFGSRVREAQGKYREFVRGGRKASQPWEQLTGQIYLGREAFVQRHQPDRFLREIPRAQTQAHRPPLAVLFPGKRRTTRALWQAYRRYGYRLREIADHLGVHYATVSRQLKRTEQHDS